MEEDTKVIWFFHFDIFCYVFEILFKFLVSLLEPPKTWFYFLNLWWRMTFFCLILNLSKFWVLFFNTRSIIYCSRSGEEYWCRSFLVVFNFNTSINRDHLICKSHFYRSFIVFSFCTMRLWSLRLLCDITNCSLSWMVRFNQTFSSLLRSFFLLL